MTACDVSLNACDLFAARGAGDFRRRSARRPPAAGSGSWVIGRPTTRESAPSSDRRRRRRDALLVASGRAGRPHARRHQGQRVADRSADLGRLGGAADQPVDPCCSRLPGAPLDQRRDAQRVARLREIGVVVEVRTQTASNLSSVPRRRRAARMVCGIGVNGEKGRAEMGDLRSARSTVLWNVVQLEIDEKAFAGRGATLRPSPSAAA